MDCLPELLKVRGHTFGGVLNVVDPHARPSPDAQRLGTRCVHDQKGLCPADSKLSKMASWSELHGALSRGEKITDILRVDRQETPLRKEEQHQVR